MSSVIDDYLADLGSRLRGPARMRRDMLREIRHSLTDATEAGEDDPTAGFGTPAEIAAGLQEALAIAQARRSAVLMIGVLGLAWAQSIRAGLDGWEQWRGEMPGYGYGVLAEAVDLLSMAALIGAAGAVVALRRGTRDRVRLVAGVIMVVVALVAVGGLLLTGLSPHGRLGEALWWVAPFAVVQLSAIRSWQLAR